MAFAEVTSEVMVLTDANVLFDTQAVRRPVRHFADMTPGLLPVWCI